MNRPRGLTPTPLRNFWNFWRRWSLDRHASLVEVWQDTDFLLEVVEIYYGVQSDGHCFAPVRRIINRMRRKYSTPGRWSWATWLTNVPLPFVGDDSFFSMSWIDAITSTDPVDQDIRPDPSPSASTRIRSVEQILTEGL